MPTIDSLSIDISASAKSADGAIENLSGKLDILANSVKSVDVSKLKNISSGIRSLSDAATGFKKAKSTELSSLANALKKFDGLDTNSFYGISNAMKSLSEGVKAAQGVDTSGINNISNAISKLGNKSTGNAAKNLPVISAQVQNFVRQMNNIGTLSFDTTNLSNLIGSISKLGGKSAGNASKNLPKLTTELNSFINAMSKAPKVSQNTIQMTNALANFAKTGASGGRAADSLSKSFENLSTNAVMSSGKVKGALSGMQNNFRNLFRSVAPFVGAFELISFGKQAMEISSDLTEVQNVIDVTFGDFKNKIEDLAKVSIADFGMSELTAKTMAGRFQAMGVAIGFSQSKMSDMSVELTKLAADMASFYNVSQKEVATSLQSIFTGETEPLKLAA